MRNLLAIATLLFVLLPTLAVGQNTIEHKITWQKPTEAQLTTNPIKILSFEGANYRANASGLPVFTGKISIASAFSRAKISLEETQFEPLQNAEMEGVDLPDIPQDIAVETEIQVDRKKAFLAYSFVPLRKNPQTGIVEKLVSFEVNYSVAKSADVKNIVHEYAANSVLNTGTWVKVSIQEDGIYKITSDELKDMGFDNPGQVRLFGNADCMLSFRNQEESYDDLSEMAIVRAADHILFYAKGPKRWYLDKNTDMFRQSQHYFSDYAFYFLTDGVGTGKSVAQENSLSSTQATVTSFVDHQYHEQEDTNLIKSGRVWYGEEFGLIDEMDFPFSFPNIITSSPVRLLTSVIARSTSNSNFYMNVNGNQVGSVENITKIIIDPDYSYAFGGSSLDEFYSSSSSFNINLRYAQPNSTAKGWLNYLSVNATRALKMDGAMMHFRDTVNVGPGKTAKFILSNATSDVQVWDVSDLLNAKRINKTASGGSFEFGATTESLREFFAFDGSQYHSIIAFEEIANQNIHGRSIPEYVIVAPEIFLPYADELAELHREKEGMDVMVVEDQMVYNEFSSGARDASAIRNMMRMFYDRATSDNDMPKYLLLFGDGSYDNKNDKSGNSNLLPTYQSSNSLHPISSYCTDDFFGVLDATESVDTGSVDIGVGRLPVSSESQASMAIEKIRNYYSAETFGDWRNMICFIGDDSDTENTVQHMSTADGMATYLAENYSWLNFDKIYLDSYPQVFTASGERYPDAEVAIKNRIENGALIVNYTGHGNELGLTHEQVIVVSDILNWTNYERLPLFITATCEFSRFDDYGRTSGGELIFLNSQGGGVSLVTTTRPVYPSTLNYKFYNGSFEKHDGEYYRIGDLLRRAKNSTSSSSNINKKKFAILGDPALQLAYPNYQVVTTHVNGVAIDEVSDTLKALSLVTIDGYVASDDSLVVASFNGVVHPKVFDKAKQMETLGNEGNEPFYYSLQDNVLYRGKASVKDGYFSFSFVVPKDISYDLGYGKLSYYAETETEDATGSYGQVFIGGSSNEHSQDIEGPAIRVFMNDEAFLPGGVTSETPRLLAFVEDSTGINTVGNGIGHDIVAVLDGELGNSLTLNDYYESDLDSYQSGKIEYTFSALEEGEHTVRLKVWDVCNNSSSDSIDFVVAESAEIAIKHLFNYPNPFTDKTAFYFEHNQAGADLDVLIQIFTVTGKLVKSIDASLFSDGFRLGPIEWDGLDDFGNKIGRGAYIYKVKIRNSEGRSIEKLEKLVILK